MQLRPKNTKSTSAIPWWGI